MGKGFVDNIIGAIVYMVAQVLGMFLAAAVVYGIYYSGEEKLKETWDNASMVCLYATCPTEGYTNNQVNFRQKYKFWSNMEFVVKNPNFGQECTF